MAFDPVPWFIGGGAAHQDEVFRAALSAATQEAQGIALPGHMKVTATATPSGQVSIAAGSVVVVNAQASGQSYIGRAATPTLVSIDPQGSGGTRTDLIIARVRDPDYSPWQPYTDPAQIAGGPYFEPAVIKGVAATTTLASQVVGYSAVELARVAVPASTTNITSGMITDLRKLARPRTWPERGLAVPTFNQTITWTNGNFQQYPSTQFTVPVPPWATNIFATYSLEGIAVTEGNVEGFLRLALAIPGGAIQTYSAQYFYSYQMASTISPERHSVTVAMDVAVPTVLRGANAVILCEATRTAGAGTLRTHGGTQVVLDASFSERLA